MFSHLSTKCVRFTPRVPFSTTSVRFQSSSKSPNLNLLKASVAAKVSKNKNEYNALSNHNLVSTQEQSSTKSPSTLNPTKVTSSPAPITKKDYKCPKVPNTSYLDPDYVSIDTFYAGYRPLAMKDLKKNLVPSRKWYVDRSTASCWSVSASGLETFSEWDELNYEDYSNLYPFRPPQPDSKVKVVYESDARDSELVYSSSLDHALPVAPQPKLKSRRGRKKPSAINLLHKKKRRFD